MSFEVYFSLITIVYNVDLASSSGVSTNYSFGCSKCYVSFLCRGELGCITVPSNTRLSFNFDPINPSAIDLPLVGDNVELSLLMGLLEPAALALDDTGGFIYLVTRDGTLYRLVLSSILSMVTDSLMNVSEISTSVFGKSLLISQAVINDGSDLPSWIQPISTGISSTSRISSLSILPTFKSIAHDLSLLCGQELEILSWQERRLVLTDVARSSLILLSTSGLSSLELYVGGNDRLPHMIWPISVHASYNQSSLHNYLTTICESSDTTSNLTFAVNLYVSEFLGKIWKQELLLPAQSTSRVLKTLHEDSTLLDLSSFTASLNVRSYFEYSRDYDPVTNYRTVDLGVPLGDPNDFSTSAERILDRQSPIRFEAFG